MTYLDHAATTPVLPEVLAAMTAQLGRVGNASSLHARRPRGPPAWSRSRASGSPRPSAPGRREVVFTGGGTESDNLAVKGIFWARRAADPRRRRIVASPVEHHAVLDAVEWLAKHEGAEVTWLPVDATAGCTPDALRRRRSAETATTSPLVTVMWANNEVGTVQPVARAGRGRRRASASRCTPTRSRPSARCRSTSPPAASTR